MHLSICLPQGGLFLRRSDVTCRYLQDLHSTGFCARPTVNCEGLVCVLVITALLGQQGRSADSCIGTVDRWSNVLDCSCTNSATIGGLGSLVPVGLRKFVSRLKRATTRVTAANIQPHTLRYVDSVSRPTGRLEPVRALHSQTAEPSDHSVVRQPRLRRCLGAVSAAAQNAQ